MKNLIKKTVQEIKRSKIQRDFENFKYCLYNNAVYILLYNGPTKFGERAHLKWIEGGNNFWTEPSKITVLDFQDSRIDLAIHKYCIPMQEKNQYCKADYPGDGYNDDIDDAYGWAFEDVKQ